MGQVLRSWHLANRSDKTLADLARMFNNVVQGWINYCVSRGHARSDWRAVALMG
jgi:hypothetical protein